MLRKQPAAVASHQTVRLSAGRHRRPEDGACVMELSSMLAGERFTDHPRSVCPVIAAFLRCYNDRVDDRRRQDLYQYAADAVGTRSDRRTRRARIELCRRFADCYGASEPWPAPGVPWVWEAERAGRLAGTAAALSSHPEAHSTALALLDTLITCSRDERSADLRTTSPTAGGGRGR